MLVILWNEWGNIIGSLLCFCLRIIFDMLYCYNLSLENFCECSFLIFFPWPPAKLRFTADDFWETLTEIQSEDFTPAVASLLASMSGTHHTEKGWISWCLISRCLISSCVWQSWNHWNLYKNRSKSNRLSICPYDLLFFVQGFAVFDPRIRGINGLNTPDLQRVLQQRDVASEVGQWYSLCHCRFLM